MRGAEDEARLLGCPSCINLPGEDSFGMLLCMCPMPTIRTTFICRWASGSGRTGKAEEKVSQVKAPAMLSLEL